MRNRLLQVEEEHMRLSREMGTQEVASDPDAYRKCAKAQALISETHEQFQRYLECEKRFEDARQMLREESDAELRAMAEEERDELRGQLDRLEEQLKILILPRDPNDSKDTIIEIRAGTGGEEAALFAADLYRMYSRFAETKGWNIDPLNSNATGMGGYKEIAFKVEGEDVYRDLKYEGGVHRVQRVPETETQGRVHTSAVTVAVLPEAEEVEIDIDPSDLQIDVYRSSGPGGQSVNTTDSAVRITHRPTGVVVTCQDEKSQHKNKAKALSVLRSRLLAAKEAEEANERSATRKSQVGSGDRSERIRTYNFPQNRLTDHRIGLTQHNLDRVMEGDFQSVVDALKAADRAAMMAEA